MRSYNGLPEGEESFEVTGSLSGGAMIMCAIDRGTGIGRARDSGGLGLGIPLIEALSDDVSFGTPAEGGTKVCMTFMIRPSGRGVRTTDRRLYLPAGV